MSARGPTHDVGLARRGLAIYFAILLPLSAVFEALMILGNLSWFWALMWTPAAASVVARLVLREGFADVSFRIGGRRGWNAIVLALIFPIIIGTACRGIGSLRRSRVKFRVTGGACDASP